MYRQIVVCLAVFVVTVVPAHLAEAYDPFAYDPWLDPLMEPAPLPDPNPPAPSPWAAPRADDYADRHYKMLDRLNRDALGQSRSSDPLVDYFQRRDEERSHSLSACMGIHSNPAAQQRCLDMLR